MTTLACETNTDSSYDAFAAMGLRLISESDTRRHMDIESAAKVISETYRSMSQGSSQLSSPSRLEVLGTPHHLGVKGASLSERDLAGVRLTSKARSLMLLWRLSDGRPLALVDESWLYRFRTGVSAAVVAASLFPEAKPETIALIGAGPIAHEMALALNQLLSPTKLRVAARRPESAIAFAHRLNGAGVAAEAAESAEVAVKNAELVITITTATKAFLHAEHLRPDAVILSMGGGPEFGFDVWQAAQTRYVDDLGYALSRGDAAGWIAGGLSDAEKIGAELTGTIGDLVAGKMPAGAEKTGPTLAIVQGVAALDIALAGLVRERLEAEGAS